MRIIDRQRGTGGIDRTRPIAGAFCKCGDGAQGRASNFFAHAFDCHGEKRHPITVIELGNHDGPCQIHSKLIAAQDVLAASALHHIVRNGIQKVVAKVLKEPAVPAVLFLACAIGADFRCV